MRPDVCPRSCTRLRAARWPASSAGGDHDGVPASADLLSWELEPPGPAPLGAAVSCRFDSSGAIAARPLVRPAGLDASGTQPELPPSQREVGSGAVLPQL